MKVLCIVNGYLEENCYIIHNNEYALIIDPGSESNKIINIIEELNLNVIGILITHYHFDHIGALEEVLNKYKNAKLFNYKSNKKRVSNFEQRDYEKEGYDFESLYANNKFVCL